MSREQPLIQTMICAKVRQQNCEKTETGKPERKQDKITNNICSYIAAFDLGVLLCIRFVFSFV